VQAASTIGLMLKDVTRLRVALHANSRDDWRAME
jgi:hypothetical protein